MNIDRLRKWAAPKGLTVSTTPGNQREPEYLVAINDVGNGPALIVRTSLDSCETAAFYLLNTLERLGVEVPE